jgi:hypothetical protein
VPIALATIEALEETAAKLGILDPGLRAAKHAA